MCSARSVLAAATQKRHNLAKTQHDPEQCNPNPAQRSFLSHKTKIPDRHDPFHPHLSGILFLTQPICAAHICYFSAVPVCFSRQSRSALLNDIYQTSGNIDFLDDLTGQLGLLLQLYLLQSHPLWRYLLRS